MALYRWVCVKCGHRVREILPERPSEPRACPNDGEVLKTDMGGSTSVMESLDNGIMIRKVERLRGIEDLRKDHGKLTDKKDPGIV